ncbi:MAG: NADH-quinone oxidoreductase subunit NuoF [Bacteroidetes bacterium]|nr:NADH-quinone oxidoreductase subunit NuoF [Bacteroidota bacterium]
MINITTLQKKSLIEWEALTHSNEPVIYLGMASCGKAAGAEKVKQVILESLKVHSINAKLIEVGCVGTCYLEPIMDIRAFGWPRISYGNVDEKRAEYIIQKHLVERNLSKTKPLGYLGNVPFDNIPPFSEQPMLKPQVRIVTRNCGIIDPENIHHYLANEGYSGIAKALKMTPLEVIEEITSAGLRGRGGAGFLTGRKWRTCYDTQSDVKYLICNADEGDPGAFMNRLLIESDPHAVLEGMLIAAYAIGATLGYIYIRAEYPLAIKRLQNAIEQMHKYGLLGDNILGSTFSFSLKIKEGAGAFVCGEETALIHSIEGKRGMPRTRPPFPAVSGLHQKPTVINNVETLGTVAQIIRNGAQWYRQYGIEGNYGTKTFSLVGKVRRSGLIEVPLGTPLRKIIFDIGGGTVKPFKAVQTGGPSGGCIPLELLDTPVTYETLASIGSIMGSGGLIVMDQDTCVVDVARYFLDFIQKESCGKCTPCRVGTRHMVEILENICHGEASADQLDNLETLAKLVQSTSLCQLGQTAPNPVLTTLRYFRSEYVQHINEYYCPALVCSSLIEYTVIKEKCTGCQRCVSVCPTEAITGPRSEPHNLDPSKCIKCRSCYEICRFDAIAGNAIVITSK